MNTSFALTGTPEWLDALRDQMLEARSLRDCVKTGATWLAEWIDLTRERPDGTSYRDFCCLMAPKLEAWRGEDEELWTWAWEAAAEIFEFYEDLASASEKEFAERFCADFDDPEFPDKEAYAKHLCLCAVSYIHGWTQSQAE